MPLTVGIKPVGNIAPAATATNPATRAYSIMSWPDRLSHNRHANVVHFAIICESSFLEIRSTDTPMMG